MTPAQFIDGRPCLEEIDGYLHRVDMSRAVEDPDLKPLVDAVAEMRVNTPPDSQVSIDTEGLRVIETWRRKLMKGKVMPADSAAPRSYEYKRNHKPVRRLKRR